MPEMAMVQLLTLMLMFDSR